MDHSPSVGVEASTVKTEPKIDLGSCSHETMNMGWENTSLAWALYTNFSGISSSQVADTPCRKRWRPPPAEPPVEPETLKPVEP